MIPTIIWGCNIGRCVNRIAKGHFIINDKEYQLECNDGENTIHSGFSAYCRRKWKYADSDDDSVTFVLNSRDGDQGFPGNLIVYITYRFLSDNEFEIEYEGVPDKDTIINMTNHSYFNLNGEGSGKYMIISLLYMQTDLHRLAQMPYRRERYVM